MKWRKEKTFFVAQLRRATKNGLAKYLGGIKTKAQKGKAPA